MKKKSLFFLPRHRNMHPVHHTHLQALPVDNQRHQESLWREKCRVAETRARQLPQSEQSVDCDTVGWLGVFMEDGFAFTEKNASESVTGTQENSFGKGVERGHMMWLTHHSPIFTFFSTTERDQQGHAVDEVRRITTNGVLLWDLGLFG